MKAIPEPEADHLCHSFVHMLTDLKQSMLP